VNLLDRVLQEPEFAEAPPVLVDVGAAGGVPREWRRLAGRAVGVGFEPDARETAGLDWARRRFRRWIFVPALAVPSAGMGGTQTFHLTRSPQCSSILPPRRDALQAWAFGAFFEVQATRELPATTIAAALAAHGLRGVDWLKCDTQGLDLRLYLSLPDAWRERLLVAEFEPGIIDAYEGEDQLPGVLTAMRQEPFFLAKLATVPMARRGPAGWSEGRRRWLRRAAARTPAWANLRFLRDVQQRAEALDRRALLLAWVFAVVCGLPDYAGVVAEQGQKRFGGALLAEMVRESERRLRWAIVRGLPQWCWRRFGWG
jgi:hypothetical protein